MGVAEEVHSVRTKAGLLELPQRGVLAVTGSDRVRWLNGMLSNDVESLAAGEGCHALLLNPKAGIVGDLHVLAHEDELWLEGPQSSLPEVKERLERYIVADDVALEPTEWRRFAIEGKEAWSVLADHSPSALPEPHSGNWTRIELGGLSLVAAAYSLSGEPGLQLFCDAEGAAGLGAAFAALPRISAQAQEILRIESGLPLLGRELGEDVLPDEAHLGDAISTTKGCYTGQEIIARLRSRGQVNHLMVALRFQADATPELGSELFADERRIGEVTSACLSPERGPIGIGFVRRVHSEPGSELSCAGERVVVSALPSPGAGAPEE